MPGPDRHEFHIEADATLDVLLRVLGPFAVQGAELAGVRHERIPEGAWAVVEVTGLAPERAELLRLRLAQLACVRDVRVRCALALVAAAK
jgi:acetolactate synthase regulatory subunit